MFFINKKRKEKGQTLAEYGIILSVVACIAIAGFTLVGSNANNKAKAEADTISGTLPTATPEPTSAYWGVSTDNVLTLSTKELAASEKSKDSGTIDLTVCTFTPAYLSSTAWGKYADAITIANIKDRMAPSDTSYWFFGMTKLTAINNIQNLDTSKDINMNSMFDRCTALTTLDVSNFDTSNVTDMWCMFEDCDKLTSLDVSHFDTSKVTDMSYMFRDCNSLTSLDTSKFVINAGTNTTDMYLYCPAHK